MSEVLTFHCEECQGKCPKCEEFLYIDIQGILKCSLCDYIDDGF